MAAGEEELFPVTHFWFLSVVGGTLARTGWRPQDCAFRAGSMGTYDAGSRVSSTWLFETPKWDILGRTGIPKGAGLKPRGEIRVYGSNS